MSAKKTAAKSKEIHLIRLYEAPVKAVWDAWTDPAQTAKWWGPRGFTLTTHSKDLRPGGHWNYTMHGPDGTDYVNTTKYFEVEKFAKLVYDHGGHADRPPLFRVTALFSEQKGKTKLELNFALDTVEAAEQTRQFIKKAGGESTWDRLDEYLGKECAGKEKFVINRSFAAPIETMFQMWTDPKHFSKWLAPTGFTMEFLRADLREGGTTIAKMSSPEMKMFSLVKYLEIRKPDRIVYTQQFIDENENISRHPKAPIWPETMLTTVTFFPEGPDQTRVHVQWEVHGAHTTEELEFFLAARGGMTMGWTGSFDKLEALLELDLP